MFFGEPFGGLIPGARGARQVHALVSDEHSL
jgi:hypothetical protein